VDLRGNSIGPESARGLLPLSNPAKGMQVHLDQDPLSPAAGNEMDDIPF
jgi:hypothetical protein